MAKSTEKPRGRVRPSIEPVDSLSKPTDSAPGPVGVVPTPTPAPAETDLNRLTLPVDPKSGFIAWDRLRNPERTKNALERIFADSRFAPAASATPADDAALNAVVVNVLYDAIGMIAVVAARTRGYSEQSAAILRYTQDEKAALAPQTIKVLNKYNLLGGKYADELTLLIAVAGITGSHVMAMQQIEAKLASVNNVRPMPSSVEQPAS